MPDENRTGLPVMALVLAALLALPLTVSAADDAGLGHDYRTFHSDGRIEYGNVGDSYTADRVGYALGVLASGRNPYNALRYMAHLGTPGAQSIYDPYGFVKATPEDLVLKPIPAAAQ